MSALLEVENLSKFFGGLAAVDNLSFKVNKDEVLGLMGPNGAGKTTIFNLITGMYKPTHGKVLFEGRDITGLPPHKICRLGIGRSYQIPQPFSNMKVLENLLVAAQHGRHLSRSDAKKIAVETLEFTGIIDKKDWLAGDLSLLDLKRLELARGLASKPKLLLMDELAAGLAEVEVEKLLGLIEQINENGITIVLIEHVMRVMVKAVQRLLVLNEGKKLAEGEPITIMKSEKVINTYLGEEKVV